MGDVFLFAVTAAFNPTLLAAVTAMLLTDHPARLLVGYLLGALMTSITIGLVIVFAFGGSSKATRLVEHTVNPAIDVALGLTILGLLFIVATGRPHRWRARRS